MQNNIISGFKDEVGETIKDEVLEFAKIVKKQVTSKMSGQMQDAGGEAQDKILETGSGKHGKKIDPVTGKPIPSKKALTQLNQQVMQLAQMRLKKVREELEKQRLRTDNKQQTTNNQIGPEIKPEKQKQKEDIVQKTLKGAKSTGEFKGLIGG